MASSDGPRPVEAPAPTNTTRSLRRPTGLILLGLLITVLSWITAKVASNAQASCATRRALSCDSWSSTTLTVGVFVLLAGVIVTVVGVVWLIVRLMRSAD